MKPEMSWVPGLVALGAGALGGAWAALSMRRRGQGDAGSAESLDMQLSDLDERFEHLTAQLKDLDEQRPRLNPDAYAKQKLDFETRAADVLRQRDALHAKRKVAMMTPDSQDKAAQVERKGSAAAPRGGVLASHPQLKGALWGGGVVAVLGFLYVTVTQDQMPRAPGGSITGNTAQGMGEAPPHPPGGPMAGGGSSMSEIDPSIRPLVAKLHENPDDIPTLEELARLFLRNQQYEPVKILSERLLTLQPGNLAGLTYQAMLKAAEGDNAGALSGLEAVLAKDKTFAQAHFFRGMLSMRMGDSEKMKESWESFVAYAPDGPQKERIKGFLRGEGLQMPNAR